VCPPKIFSHIDIRRHYIRELCLENLVKLVPLRTNLMVADALTKSLPEPGLECHRSVMSLPEPGLECHRSVLVQDWRYYVGHSCCPCLVSLAGELALL
jgi:hypothetical protein